MTGSTVSDGRRSERGVSIGHATSGIHHITAFAGDPAVNLDFYTRVLGLRLVKQTVNFDDPGTYHLYFGDGRGSPGTAMTFFPWAGSPQGVQGSGSVTATAFAVPVGSLGAWRERLAGMGVAMEADKVRFGATVLRFADPDGTRLEIVEAAGVEALPAWEGDGVSAAMAIRGFFGATLSLRSTEHTVRMLTEHLGMVQSGVEGDRTRFVASGVDGDGKAPLIGRVIDLLHTPGMAPGRGAAGLVHHIAMRAVDDAQQGRMADGLREAGFGVTAVRDRFYFHSVYYRERGGVLFEIATDGPGFGTDEPADGLGGSLMLPPMYEPMRRQIEAGLPPLLKGAGRSTGASGAGAYTHLFIPPTGRGDGRWLLLLHGTGGDERDLLPLGEKLLPGGAVLSPRGDVDEGGHLRFFRRFAEGVFDLPDVERAAAKLAGWIGAAAERYGLDPSKGTAVGFSNGANLMGATLLRHGGVVGSAVLIRAMRTLGPAAGVSLAGTRVLLSSGTTDAIVPLADARGLAESLQAAGAEVRHVELPVGHTLVAGDLAAAREFIGG